MTGLGTLARTALQKAGVSPRSYPAVVVCVAPDGRTRVVLRASYRPRDRALSWLVGNEVVPSGHVLVVEHHHGLGGDVVRVRLDGEDAP